MSNTENLRMKKLRRSLLWKTLASMAVYTVALFVFLWAAYWLYSLRTWYGNEWLYRLLHFGDFSLDLWFKILLVLGYFLIFYYFWKKPFLYLEEVAQAAEKFSKMGEEELIQLSLPLQSVEGELNRNLLALRNSQRAAKEAEQKKNDLVAYLAHDLKTPITSVIGYLTLLRDEPQISPELRARYTGIALNKAQRLEELINEFFDITRFNLTHLTLEMERIDFSLMLQQIASEFTPILREKELEWRLEIPANVELLCDPDKLERVFDNLLRNAVNYSYRGTEIRLCMQQVGQEVMVQVQNHGKTIAPEKLERLFEQFFRLDSSRGSTGGGAGLGLAIAKEIVELHRGRIVAESGQETIVFTVYLPR